MQVLIPGYTYKLNDGTVVNFPGLNRPAHTVTTTEEVAEVLMHRHQTLNAVKPCRENRDIVCHMATVKALQEYRQLRMRDEKADA